MQKPLPNQDIEFQPAVNEYSYNSQKPKRSLNIFFVLVVSIIILSLLIIGILNYVKAFPISVKLPKITPVPSPVYDQTSKTYKLRGNLYGYDKFLIKVKYYNQIITFKFNLGLSEFYVQTTSKSQLKNIDFSEIPHNLAYFSDLEQEKNIGKEVYVKYIKNNRENIIQTMIIAK